MAIFKNKNGELFIDTDNFPIITLNGDKLVCPVCRVMLCCNKKQCNCGYEKATLQDTYIFQKNEMKEKQREKLLKVKLEKGEGYDAEGRIMIHQSEMCPNTNCSNHAYYCRNGCITNPDFDMSKYTIVRNKF